MVDLLALLGGICIGLIGGCIIVLVVNENWHRLAQKQNREWAEFNKAQNERWFALALKVSRSAESATSDLGSTGSES